MPSAPVEPPIPKTPCEQLHEYRLWLEREWLPGILRTVAGEPEPPRLRSLRSQITELERETAELLGVPVEKPRLTLIEGGRDAG